MAGFIRRFGYNPGIEQITQIEGVVIVDTPPPGAVNGISNGVVGVVGEFSDMTYATQVSSSGVVATKAQPVEVFSSQDMLTKLGGWDETLGNFGTADGNGFALLRNKKFSRLVCVPVNLASAGAGRVWRELPTNKSASIALPIVPMQGGVVQAGREFATNPYRVRLAKRVNFTGLGHFKNGTDGAVTAAGAATSGAFTAAGGGFLTAYNGGPVPKGSILVLGTIGGAGALGANALTLRVTAQASSNTSLTVEKLDGSSFTWTTGTNLPWRLHPQSDADSAGLVNAGAYALADTGGYGLPCRPVPLAAETGTVPAATSLAPVSVPTAGSASSWDPLSGLTLRSHQSAGFVYVAATQGRNAVNDATIDALYLTALDSLLADEVPARDVNIVLAARTSTNIRTALKAHVLSASEVGLGRLACLSPGLDTVSSTTAISSSDPGVGATRHERVEYAWPGLKTFIPEAVGTTLSTADGNTTTDGVLDTRSDAWLASVLSNLPPERNPGQSGAPVSTIMAPVLGIQRGMTALTVGDYSNMRAYGICGPRIDSDAGAIFQSGVTSSLTSGEKNISRRRMADFIQDSVGRALKKFVKQPLTTALKDAVVGEIDAFLNQLKSPNNPAAQRIVDYSVDDKSGNTPDLEARGVFVVIGRARTLASADFIVFQSEVGEGVKVTAS